MNRTVTAVATINITLGNAAQLGSGCGEHQAPTVNVLDNILVERIVATRQKAYSFHRPVHLQYYC
jgi:hypothetical protein